MVIVMVDKYLKDLIQLGVKYICIIIKNEMIPAMNTGRLDPAGDNGLLDVFQSIVMLLFEMKLSM